MDICREKQRISRQLQNLHTHTTLCDGKDTPEAVVQEAIRQGFSSIGFSIHSAMSFSSYVTVTPQSMLAYKDHIAALKEAYRDDIAVFCGVEAEMLAENDLSGYDYVIGSAHYLKIGSDYVGFDRDAKTVEGIIHTYFGGDGLRYARAYYETLAQMPQFIRADILGHVDLIAKHSEQCPFFDETDTAYMRYAYEAIDALQGKVPYFEVNTGAMARGYRTTPYPSVPLTNYLLAKGFLPIISSDCHDKAQLSCGFDLAAELLRACGAKAHYILTENGFEGVVL